MTCWLIVCLEFVTICLFYDVTVEASERDIGSRADQKHNRILSEFNRFELVEPKVYRVNNSQEYLTSTNSKSSQHLNDVILEFSAFQRHFIVDLRLNRNLFGSAYVEKLATRLNRYSDQTGFNCYYHGEVRGNPGSSAAVSTCDGVRGQIVGSDDVFYIEPETETGSLSRDHFLVRQSDLKVTTEFRCDQTSDAPTADNLFNDTKKNVKRSVDHRDGFLIEPSNEASIKYVELYVAIDHSQFVEYGRSEQRVIQRTKDTINIVNSIYRPLGIYIVLVGIEVWTDGDKIPINGDADETMNAFLEYRRKHIAPNHHHDNAQLIIGRDLGSGVVGKAPIMTICTFRTSGGVNADRHSVPGPIATTVAHELGHNFGLPHDFDPCSCPDDRCIMAASGGGVVSPTKWSDCSKDKFIDAFHQGMDYCLHDVPLQTHVSSSCGNGLTEEGEECDCGLEKDCTNPCCVASTCTLKINATCASGNCCDLSVCRPKSAGSECRGSKGSCDLPEFCDGSNKQCPSDVFKKDGLGCNSNGVASYCYGGKCSTHDGQCQMLWGPSGRRSHRMCFDRFNIMGTAHGHCGFSWTDEVFQKCEPKDVMCGMLYCEHQSEKLMFWKEALVYTMQDWYVDISGQRYYCKSSIFDVGLDMPDPGRVFDGTKCADDMMCQSGRCQRIEDLNLKSCDTDCSGHGVCNSIGQCHCDAGYAPPNCDVTGYGGSLHSGPASKQYGIVDIGLIVGLCIVFFILLPSVALVCFIAYDKREKIKRCLSERWVLCRMRAYRYVTKSRPRNDVELPSAVAKIDVIVVSSIDGQVMGTTKASSIRRTPSFRPEDIYNPKLQSSTNSGVLNNLHEREQSSSIFKQSSRSTSTTPNYMNNMPPFSLQSSTPSSLQSSTPISLKSTNENRKNPGNKVDLMEIVQPNKNGHVEQTIGPAPQPPAPANTAHLLQPTRPAPVPQHPAPTTSAPVLYSNLHFKTSPVPKPPPPTKSAPVPQPMKTAVVPPLMKTTPLPQPTKTTPAPSPTKTTPVPQPTKTTPVPPPTKTTPVPPPTKTTPVPQSTKTTSVPQPTKAASVPQPTKTTPLSPPTKTTPVPPPTKTTPVPPPTKTTPVPQSTKTTSVPQPTKAASVPQPTKTTPLSPPTKTTPVQKPTKTTPVPPPTKTTPVPQPTKAASVPQPTKTTPVPQPNKKTAVPRTTKPVPVPQTTKTDPVLHPTRTAPMPTRTVPAPRQTVPLRPSVSLKNNKTISNLKTDDSESSQISEPASNINVNSNSSSSSTNLNRESRDEQALGSSSFSKLKTFFQENQTQAPLLHADSSRGINSSLQTVDTTDNNIKLAKSTSLIDHTRKNDSNPKKFSNSTNKS